MSCEMTNATASTSAKWHSRELRHVITSARNNITSHVPRHIARMEPESSFVHDLENEPASAKTAVSWNEVRSHYSITLPRGSDPSGRCSDTHPHFAPVRIAANTPTPNDPREPPPTPTLLAIDAPSGDPQSRRSSPSCFAATSLKTR